MPLLIKLRTSASAGRAGIAPFLIVVIAPHAFANLSTSLNLGSSCNLKHVEINQTLKIMKNHRDLEKSLSYFMKTLA